MKENALFQQRERTFKHVGATLEAAFKHIDRGLYVVERMDQARDESERELYYAMVIQSVHHSWQTITKLMRRIAKDVDNDTPKGKGAARALVDRMSQRTNERPVILGAKHLETVRRIEKLHRDYRQAKITHTSAMEIVEFLDIISDEIVPEIMENVRVLALSSPGGAKLITHLNPGHRRSDEQVPMDNRNAG